MLRTHRLALLAVGASLLASSTVVAQPFDRGGRARDARVEAGIERERPLRPGDPRDRHRMPRGFYGGRGDNRWRWAGPDATPRWHFNYPTPSWTGGYGPYY